ncbi:MAG: hypothetical protein U9O94_05780 [Nanoarchaeota archaeon]|nr:hypothetical protein [Nanoarchaeota archaeon]
MNKLAIAIILTFLLALAIPPLEGAVEETGCCYDVDTGTGQDTTRTSCTDETFILGVDCIEVNPDTPGCCFRPSIPSCEDHKPISECGGDTEFFLVEPCSDIDKCDEGCCCERTNPFTKRGVCEDTPNGLFRYDITSQTTCIDACLLDKPLCGIECEELTEPCYGLGIQTEIITALPTDKKYYCGLEGLEISREFSDQTQCETVCDTTTTQIDYGTACTGANGYCCDGCFDDTRKDELGTFKYNLADPPDPYYCSPTEPYCCAQCAEAISGCCEYDEWQCTDNNGVVINKVYNSCPSPNIPCTKPCSTLPTCLIDTKINDQLNSDQGNTFCTCDDNNPETNDAKDTTTDGNYCCLDGGAKPSCEGETFTISGAVKKGTIQQYEAVEGAEVQVNGESGISGTGGSYTIRNIPISLETTVIVSAFKRIGTQFLTGSITISPTVGAVLTGRDIILEEGTEEEGCFSINPFSPKSFEVHPIKGKKSVNLTWKNPCPATIDSSTQEEKPSPLVSYFITRRCLDDATGCEHPLLEIPLETNHDAIIIDAGECTDTNKVERCFAAEIPYIDETVEWSTEYKYFIYAKYVTGAESAKVGAEIITGDEYCENKFENGIPQEFCLDDDKSTPNPADDIINGIGAICDEENKLDLANSVNCADLGKTCVGPDENGITECKNKIDCNYNAGNPFGLFYTENTCLGNNDNNYCYYDYSNTIVDTCSNCESIGTCYDYKGKDACEKDNCGVSANAISSEDGEFKNSGCSWLYTYESLGKGICYDSDYEETDYCSELCSADSDVFQNDGCDEQRCNLLGNCYLDDATSSCVECTADTKCEDYNSPEECIGSDPSWSGGQEIDFNNNCPTDITYSDDSCGIGLCKWDFSSQDRGCYKDADDDGTEDCSGLNEVACKKDRTALETKIKEIDTEHTIRKMNESGDYITFVLNEDPVEFWVCVDEDNTCCPSSLADGKNIENRFELIGTEYMAKLNPKDDFLNSMDITNSGAHFIRYYSVDSSRNVEKVKSNQFYIDAVKPKLAPPYSFSYDDGNIYHLTIKISNEFADCRYDPNSGLPILEGDRIVSDNFNQFNLPYKYDLYNPETRSLELFRNTYVIEFRNLNEDSNFFRYTCRDSAGNEQEGEAVIGPKTLTIISPSQETAIKSDGTVNFQLGTLYEYEYCWLKRYEREGFATIESDQLMEYEGPNENPDVWYLYRYKKELTGFSEQSYIATISCKRSETEEDFTAILFTVDNTPPETLTPDFDFDKDQKPDAEGKVSIPFQCIDPVMAGQPGEAGCDRTYVCDQYPCTNQEDYILLDGNTFSTASTSVQFYSVDKAGNKEETNYEAILRDAVEPKVIITSLSYGVTVRSKLQTISGTASDNKIIDTIIIKIESEGKEPLIETIENINSQSYTFSKNMELFVEPNTVITNTITVTATDQAGQTGTDIITVDLDSTPTPIILYPDLPTNVYSQSYIIKGITVPEAQVKISILNGANELQGEYPIPPFTAREVIEPIPEFTNKHLSDLILDTYPKAGDISFTFKEDLTTILNVNDYLEFSDPSGNALLPRYRITNRIVATIGFQKITTITIDKPLDTNVVSTGATYAITAYPFAGEYPDGWFSITVQFIEGINKVVISAQEPSGIQSSRIEQTTYEEGSFTITQKTPDDNIVNYGEFINYAGNGDGIVLEVETKKDNIDLQTSCTISHNSDIIAGTFQDVLMSTSSGTTHSFLIDSTDCKENSGDYCLIGGTPDYQVNYHHYTITCTPTQSDYSDMPPVSLDVCFTVATYGEQTGEQPRGANLCSTQLSNCGSAIPLTCEGGSPTLIAGEGEPDSGVGGGWQN